jgi:hypothetical protein
MTELESFRAEKDRFSATHPKSPLMPEQKRDFRRWACSITPHENRLKVPIRAGEKLFPD